MQKRINFRRKLLYRLLGGKLIDYKISKRTSEIPYVINSSSQLLMAWDNISEIEVKA